jgi:hypothetical protein
MFTGRCFTRIGKRSARVQSRRDIECREDRISIALTAPYKNGTNKKRYL